MLCVYTCEVCVNNNHFSAFTSSLFLCKLLLWVCVIECSCTNNGIMSFVWILGVRVMGKYVFSNRNLPTSLLILTNKNYHRWCAHMRVIFWFQDVTKIVRHGLQELKKNPSDVQITTHHDVEKRDGKPLLIIHQCIDANNFEKIVLANTTKVTLDILQRAHGGANKLKMVKL